MGSDERKMVTCKACFLLRAFPIKSNYHKPRKQDQNVGIRVQKLFADVFLDEQKSRSE